VDDWRWNFIRLAVDHAFVISAAWPCICGVSRTTLDAAFYSVTACGIFPVKMLFCKNAGASEKRPA
jgi:hypothetical protein